MAQIGDGGFGFGVTKEDRQLERRLAKWQSEVSDLTSFWTEKFAPKFLGDIQTNWDTQGGYVGGWAANAPGYAAWKRRRYGAHLGVLELSLRLRGSLQWLGHDIGPEGIFEPTPSDVVIGTRVPYGKKHQEGDGQIQRRFLFFHDPRSYDRLWKDWVTERAEESGIDVE